MCPPRRGENQEEGRRRVRPSHSTQHHPSGACQERQQNKHENPERGLQLHPCAPVHETSFHRRSTWRHNPKAPYCHPRPLTQGGDFSCQEHHSFSFFLINLFIYLYLLLAVLGLPFCARAFSSCGERGPLFIAVRGPLTIAASLVAEQRLQTRRPSSCGAQAQVLCGMWDLPRPGLEPVSPALAGRFSTTAPAGKPLFLFFLNLFYRSIVDLQCCVNFYSKVIQFDMYVYIYTHTFFFILFSFFFFRFVIPCFFCCFFLNIFIGV